MDHRIIKNAIGGLDEILSNARRALFEIGREEFSNRGYYYSHDGSGYEEPHMALAGFLEELYDSLLVILEAAQMPEAKASLIAAWPNFLAMRDKLSHTDLDEEYVSCTSPAFTYVDRLIAALRMTVSHQITSEQAWTLARLEAMLNDTDGLIHRRGKPPANEMELQTIMHDYLSAAFPDFTDDPHIGGAIKNFKPDCGIISVGAAIEFKIARSAAEAKVAFTGVVEDTGGYKGSKDWTRFYAVMYQAKPYILRSQLQSDMKRIGAATWKPILINGAVSPKKTKKKKSTKTSKAKRSAKSQKP